MPGTPDFAGIFLAVCNLPVLFRRETVFFFLPGPPSAAPGTANFAGISRQYRDRPNSRLNDVGNIPDEYLGKFRESDLSYQTAGRMALAANHPAFGPDRQGALLQQ